MRRSLPICFVLAIAFALVAAPAAADPAAPPAASSAKGRGHAKGAEKRAGVPAERFRRETEARLGRARERLEQNLGRKKVSGARAQEARQRFEAGAQQVRARLGAVASDGVVTRPEAREVKELLAALRTRPSKPVAEKAAAPARRR